jgi:hypothetical protein
MTALSLVRPRLPPLGARGLTALNQKTAAYSKGNKRGHMAGIGQEFIDKIGSPDTKAGCVHAGVAAEILVFEERKSRFFAHNSA